MFSKKYFYLKRGQLKLYGHGRTPKLDQVNTGHFGVTF